MRVCVVALLLVLPAPAAAQSVVENTGAPWRSLEADKGYCADYAYRMTRQGYRSLNQVNNGLVSGLLEIGMDEAAKSNFWSCLSNLGWTKVSEKEQARRYAERQQEAAEAQQQAQEESELAKLETTREDASPTYNGPAYMGGGACAGSMRKIHEIVGRGPDRTANRDAEGRAIVDWFYTKQDGSELPISFLAVEEASRCFTKIHE